MQYIGYFLVDLSLSPYLLYRLDKLWWAAKISNNPFSGLPLSESAYNYLIRPSSSAQTTPRTMGDLHEARMIVVNLLFLRGTSDITQSRPGLSIRGSRDRRRGAHQSSQPDKPLVIDEPDRPMLSQDVGAVYTIDRVGSFCGYSRASNFLMQQHYPIVLEL